MESLELTVNEVIDIVANNDMVGHGSYGIVYKLDDDTLFKFKYKEFAQNFNVVDNKYQTRQLNDFSPTIKEKKLDYELMGVENPNFSIEQLINLQDNIKLTKLTKGLVMVDGYCVGYLLHYHKDMVPLYDYIKNNEVSQETKTTLQENIINAVKELCENKIFKLDLTTKNILVNPNTLEVQIIDFEDEWTKVNEGYNNKYNLNDVKRRLEEICGFVSGKYQEDVFLNRHFGQGKEIIVE